MARTRPPPRLEDLSTEELEALLHDDLATFIQVMYSATKSGEALVWSSYLSLLASRLEDVAHGRRRNLIFTMPPRHLKSYCVSAALPAFVLGHYPAQEVMCVSYGQDLANEFARQTLAIMESAIYRATFGEVLLKQRQPLATLRTRQGGIRRATSLEGVATGVGADLLIFDDPQKPGETLSEAVRRSTNETYEHTFSGRSNHPTTARQIIVMQRLHDDDFVSHVVGLGGNWELINLPAIAEEDQAIPYATVFGKRVYRRGEGEALHPVRVPLALLNQRRQEVGEAMWATQYQQRPAPAGGGLVKIEWFKRYRDPELPTAFDKIVQSWDTANKTKEWNDYSVCTTWGIKQKRAYLIHVWRKRMIYPELKPAVLEHARQHGATVVLIEDQASGIQLLQDLVSEAALPGLVGIKPDGDKATRMIGQTAPIENGFVYVPAEVEWLAEYLHELSLFPNCRYFDQVDSTSQALKWIFNYRMPGEGWMQYMAEVSDEIRQARGLPPRPRNAA